MTSEEESALIREAVAGEAAALERLLQDRRARLLAYIVMHVPARLRPLVEPQDVLQEVLYDVCRRIGTFREQGPEAFTRWTLTVARNVIVDLSRRVRAAKRGGGYNQVQPAASDSAADNPMAALLDHFAAYTRTPSQSAAAHEMVEVIERSIDRLPDDYRKVVRLRHIEGLSVREAAEKMNRTENALQVLCCRALQALRQDLQSASNLL